MSSEWEEKPKVIDIYTDGAYTAGGFGWAFVVVSEDGRKICAKCGAMTDVPDGLASQRNVAAELKAAMMAAAWAKEKGVAARIHHDYAGVSRWVTNAWSTKNEYTKAYREYMQDHPGVYDFRDVDAHSGDHWNEEADRLAKRAARRN